jgi:hypothetical protein
VAAIVLNADASAHRDVESIEPAQAWERLDAMIDTGALAQPPPEVGAARRWLATVRPLQQPVGPGQEDDALAAAFVAVRWLARQADPRTPAAVMRARRVRRAGLSVGVAVLAAAVLAVALRPRNIARDKPVTGSSQPEGSSRRPAGLTNGLVELTCGAETKEEASPWFVVDLGASEALDRIVVYNRGDRDPAANLPLALDVGDSLASLETVATRTETFTRTRPWTVSGLHRAARYVRVRKTTPGSLALGEIEVYR